MNGLPTPFAELGLQHEDRQYRRVGTHFSPLDADSGSLSLLASGERLSVGAEPEQSRGYGQSCSLLNTVAVDGRTRDATDVWIESNCEEKAR